MADPRSFRVVPFAGRVLSAAKGVGIKQWTVLAVIAAIVLARSSIFVFWEQSYFDSNQAIFGLMAKHLIELRAFPVFMYGQNYMLALEAWMAAPVFLIAGMSVAALKLPLLAINGVIAIMFLWLLQRDARLPASLAGVATLFFVLPPPGTAAQLLEASGGNVEPFLYVLLLWVTRHRPVACGLILGLGFVHREFTIYGLAGLLVLDAAKGTLFTRDHVRRTLITLGSGAVVWLVFQMVSQHGSALGPGTTIADLRHGESQIVQLGNRFCFEWNALPTGLWRILTVHWPFLFGTAVQPIRRFEIESDVTQGMDGVGMVLGVAMLLAACRIGMHLAKERRWRKEYDFCAYLLLVGIFSVTGYVIARCGVIDVFRMRYELLSMAGAVGLAGWFLCIERSRAVKGAWVLLVIAWAAVGAAAHGRLWLEYLRDPPTGGKQRIIAELNARGIRYGIGQYRDAYIISFLTNEHILIASDRVRILSYQSEFYHHVGEAVRIRRRPCPGGEMAMPGIYFCPP